MWRKIWVYGRFAFGSIAWLDLLFSTPIIVNGVWPVVRTS